MIPRQVLESKEGFSPKANEAASRAFKGISKITYVALKDMKQPLDTNEAVKQFYQGASGTNKVGLIYLYNTKF